MRARWFPARPAEARVLVREHAPGFSGAEGASFDTAYSGGAAISPTAEQAFREATGKQVHNADGLTETTSPMTATPRGSAPPGTGTGARRSRDGQGLRQPSALKPGAQVTEQEMIAHCKQRVAAYKYPRRVELVNELPKTVTGKVLRRELRSQAAGAG